MGKLSKSDIKHLKAISMKLPKCYTAENQKTVQFMTGETLIKMGKTKDRNGKPLDPNNTYQWVMSGGVEVNHYKRLKKLCEDGKYAEAQNYINQVVSIESPHIDLLKGLSNRIKSIQ